MAAIYTHSRHTIFALHFATQLNLSITKKGAQSSEEQVVVQNSVQKMSVVREVKSFLSTHEANQPDFNKALWKTHADF